MGKNQSASGLTNIIQYDNRGNISFVSGSTTLMQVSSSGAITTTGVISGSSAQSASLAQNSNLLQGTGSVGFATTSSFATASGSISTRVTQIEQVYATTGSNSFRATQSITGSLTVTGQIVAQTLNVQQVTSSIVFSSGSNTFGCDLNSRQTFTGSMFVTGSSFNANVNTACFSNQVCAQTVIASTCLAVRGGNATLVVNNIAGGASNNHVAMQRNDTQYASIGLNASDNFTVFGINTSCARLTIDSNGVACFARQICSAFISANAIDVSNGGASTPINACVGYGMFGYSGVGLGIASGASGGNQGVGFFLCGIERGRWISSGNLGIGTLCPSFPLDVNGTIRSTGTLIGNNGSISTSTICTIASTTLCSSRGIVIDANTTTNNAFVPIGFSWASSISSYDPTWGMAFKAINYNAGIADLAFYTAGNVRMTVTNGGAVGIANTNPTYRLDVSGTVRIADGGRLYINQLLPLGIVFRNDEFPDGDGSNTQVTDTAATNGNAKRRLSSAASTTFFYGPYTTIPAGTYIAYFRLKVTNNSSSSSILYMDITNVVIPGGGVTIAPNSFAASNRYQYFKIPFIVTDPTAIIEFRGLSFVGGITDIFLDHVMVLPGS